MSNEDPKQCQDCGGYPDDAGNCHALPPGAIIREDAASSSPILRVFMESDEYGREYFGPYDDRPEMLAAVSRLIDNAIAQHDGIDRRIGIQMDHTDPDSDEFCEW